jgi:hypothetical protein
VRRCRHNNLEARRLRVRTRASEYDNQRDDARNDGTDRHRQDSIVAAAKGDVPRKAQNAVSP